MAKGNRRSRILEDKKRGTERECCLNCFYRVLEGLYKNVKYYCIEKDYAFEDKIEIYFTWCSKHRYDVPEDDKTSVVLRKYDREIKII